VIDFERLRSRFRFVAFDLLGIFDSPITSISLSESSDISVDSNLYTTRVSWIRDARKPHDVSVNNASNAHRLHTHALDRNSLTEQYPSPSAKLAPDFSSGTFSAEATRSLPRYHCSRE
jgi:hypothetical protein